MKSLSSFVILSLLSFPSFGQLNSWSSNGVSNGGNTNGTVVDFATSSFFPNSLYATGFFTQIDGQNANYVSEFDGVNWTELGGGLPDAGHSLIFFDSTLFLARYESGLDSNWIHYLENNTWKNLGKGFYLTGANASQFYTCNLFDVIQWNGQIIACGEFDRNGSDTIFGIAAWDGQNWNPLGAGLSGPMFGQVINPHQLLEWNGDLLVCGNFIMAGSDTVNGIARWDGTSWTSFGDGFNSTVYAMQEYNGELYAGGSFTMSGSDTLLRIAKWNGTNWVNPGFGFDLSNPQGFCWIHTLYNPTIPLVNNDLYCAGGFDQVIIPGGGNQPAGNIIAYNGSIDYMNGGLNGEVEALAQWFPGLVAGGFFSAANTPTPVQLSKLAFYKQLPVGIEEETKHHSCLFPNPAHDHTQLKTSWASGEVEWKIFNSFGSMIKSGKGELLDIKDLSPGAYFIKGSSNGNSFTQTLIKN